MSSEQADDNVPSSPPTKKRALEPTEDKPADEVKVPEITPIEPEKEVPVDEATHVIAVDVETSGPNLKKNFMPEFSASFLKIGQKTPIGTFYRLLKQPEGREWSQKTLAEFWNKPDAENNNIPPIIGFLEREQREEKVDLAEAMDAFVDWIRECQKEVEAAKGLLLIITDTSGFDVKWIDYYLSHYSTKADSLDEALGYYQPTRDISSFMLGVGRKLKAFKSSETAFNVLGTNKEECWGTSFAHNHDPQSDANHIAATASFVLARIASPETK